MNSKNAYNCATESVVNQECFYCKNKATHILVAQGMFSGTRLRFICNEHKKAWYNGTLNI